MINKTTLIILITLIGILYLIIEGRKEYYNQDNKNTNAEMATYLKTGVNSTINKLCSAVGNMTTGQLTTASQISNFCLKAIVK